jgi:hypothetical protein
MRVALSLLLFSTVLLFSPAARASDVTAAPPVYFVTDAPEPGSGFYAGFLERFTQFEDFGWLSFTSALYTFHNEGSQGYSYRSYDNLTPGFKPGIYLRYASNGALAAALSLSGGDKGIYKNDGPNPGSGRRFCFFVGPEFKEAFGRMIGAIGMPAVDNADSRHNSDYGMRCGLIWRFR